MDLLGGPGLSHMRLIHALSGLVAIAFGFLFFRMCFDLVTATIATVVLGASHALLAISRMAMRDNTGLVIETAALGLLFYGFSRRSLRATFVGGALSGLAFYAYYPGRMVIVIWFTFLLLAVVFLRDELPVRQAIRNGAVAAFGFFLLVAPLAIATVQADDSPADFAREQLLFLPEGRELQAEWVSASSEADGVARNIMNGLTTFNSSVSDHGNIYPNEGHGFVDPLSGILLWVGAAIAGYRLIRVTPKHPADLLALVGFLLLYCSFAFLINKAPNYTRLLVILPFVAYFVALAIEAIAHIFARRLVRYSIVPRQFPFEAATMTALVAAVVVWNLAIFGSFAIAGRNDGDDIGSTGRYIEARSQIVPYTFILVADTKNSYYVWGEAPHWRQRMEFFADSRQSVQVYAPDAFQPETATPPFTVFTSDEGWERIGRAFSARFPDAVLSRMRTDGSLLAFEVR
jgi:4-amino-4-deoxy-L-arabinose transferase-like glycosyltransferase